MKKINLKALLKGIVEDAPDISISGITSDSRKVQKDNLFLACIGDTVDARKYIPEVIKFAAVVLYEKDGAYQPPENITIPIISVQNLDQQKGEIASRFYGEPSKKIRCVGVTGTNGKTSCTQMIAQLLSQMNIRCSVIGTLGSGFPGNLKNTGFTTPNAILLQKELARILGEGASAVALEVSSHALEQGRVNGVNFDVAVFTQLSRDHLDYHGDMQSYANAKAKLFRTKNLKHAIINIDDKFGQHLVKEIENSCDVITYSLKKDSNASIRATNIRATSHGFSVDVDTPWGQGKFNTELLGEFNLSNLLAVLGVLGVFSISLDDALGLFQTLVAIPGRMQLVRSEQQAMVVVDYSHTPDALEKALLALREHCSGKLWCVFGCGGDRDKGKRSEMAKAAETYSDYVIVTNDNPRTESPEQIVDDIMSGFSEPSKAEVVLDRASAIAYVIQQANKEDTILVAGKGHETYQIIGEKMLPFNDVEQIQAVLARREN